MIKHEIEREITESEWNNFGVLYRTVKKINPKPGRGKESLGGREENRKKGGEGGKLGWTNILVIRWKS